MPSPKIDCPTCDGQMSPTATSCRKCKPSYDRTGEHRAKMSESLTGKPKPHLLGRKRPGHSRTMKEYWTEERREAKRAEMLLRNPSARYHGLSARGARKIREAVGRCELCGHDGSESRLTVHHRDRDKQNQSLSNLIVLCHRCHMRDHAAMGETGWQRYHQKRKTNLS